MTELVVALLMIVQGEIKEARIYREALVNRRVRKCRPVRREHASQIDQAFGGLQEHICLRAQAGPN